MSDENSTFVFKGREYKRFEMRETPEGTVAVETPEFGEFRRMQKLHEDFAMANVDEVDKVYKGQDLAKNVPKLQMYVDRFEKKYKHINLYLWSILNGTQKSTVARWICRRLIERGFTAHFILMGTLTKALTRRGYDDQDEWLLDTVATVDFLVVDDAFDPKKVTLYKSGYQIPFLDEFLRQRLEMDRRATCFTSNVCVDSVEGFGPSLASLVKRSVPWPMEMRDVIEDFAVEDLWK